MHNFLVILNDYMLFHFMESVYLEEERHMETDRRRCGILLRHITAVLCKQISLYLIVTCVVQRDKWDLESSELRNF